MASVLRALRLTSNLVARQPAFKSFVGHRSLQTLTAVLAPKKVKPAAKSTSTKTKPKKSSATRSVKTKAKPKAKKAVKASTRKAKKRTAKKVAQKPKVPQRLAVAPKRPSSNGFTHFVKSEIGSVSSPDEAQKEIVRLAAEWKAMSDAEKQPFNAQAKSAFQAYVREREIFEKNLSPEERSAENAYRRYLNRRNKSKNASKARRKMLRNPKASPTPLNAYMLFVRDIRRNNPPAGSVTEQANEFGRLWRGMSTSEKSKYHNMYASSKNAS